MKLQNYGENFKNLLANQDVGAALVNSFKYAILLTIVSMVIGSLAGYGFEIYHDKAKDAVMDVICLLYTSRRKNILFKKIVIHNQNLMETILVIKDTFDAS